MTTTHAAAQRGEFKNEPLTDFGVPANRHAFEQALSGVRARLGRDYPLIVGGREIWTRQWLESTNPARPDELVGRFARSDAQTARQAVDVADEAFRRWRSTPVGERAATLFTVADTLRSRKHEFSAWMVFEVGKSWVEADADTAEAIDFLEYYARQMIELDQRGREHLVNIPAEDNLMLYIPLGVGAVIPPWNFPLAILTGMTSAAIVAGNTVVLKPSSQSPAIAWQLFDAFRAAGLPDGALSFLVGSGSEVGDVLVDHPKTRFIAFTGSKEVGVRINQRAAQVQPGQVWIKRTILEMGGKDAVVVDETADLDAAATGIVHSAFGYQGQKCSAGSRAIIVDAVCDQVLELVVEKTKQIVKVGDPTRPDTYMGPVIDSSAFDKINQYIQVGREEGRLVLGGDSETPGKGYFISPTIFSDVPPDARIAREEIFGPVLAVIRARDFEDALEIANSTEYGLTGSLYSRDPERIERAQRDFHVGNLYFNRKCTGALVGVHPFGGFNMSGTDSKAGGPDYLLLFTQPKAVSAVRGSTAL